MPAPTQSPQNLLDRPLRAERIVGALGNIGPEFRDSPQFEAPFGGELFGCRLVIKVETLNPIRSFKARGAQNFMAQLPEPCPLVCATAGNFGQGVAYAARDRNCPLTIFAYGSASEVKIERMRSLGATVQVEGKTPDEARRAAAIYATSRGALLVEDGRHPAIAEGAGTIALELLEWGERLDAIIAPVGDGALLGGMACWTSFRSPSTKIIGVCSAGAPAMALSWRSAKAISAPCSSIANGIAIETPFAAAVARLQDDIDDILLVEDAALFEAMKIAHRKLSLVLEPSGAAALAAIMSNPAMFKGATVGVVLTGGNLSGKEIKEWLF